MTSYFLCHRFVKKLSDAEKINIITVYYSAKYGYSVSYARQKATEELLNSDLQDIAVDALRSIIDVGYYRFVPR